MPIKVIKFTGHNEISSQENIFVMDTERAETQLDLANFACQFDAY